MEGTTLNFIYLQITKTTYKLNHFLLKVVHFAVGREARGGEIGSAGEVGRIIFFIAIY